MSKKVLTTLVDKNHLEYAKALFASVYFNSGWEGDYMVLAYDIPEEDLLWFREKGIFIKHCKPLDEFSSTAVGWSHFFLTKFYLFEEDMKKWDKVLYIDVDCIVRASLSKIMKVKIIGGIPFYISQKTFTSQGEKIKSKEFFISGTYVFDTSIITPDTFSGLLKTRDKVYKEFPSGVDNMGIDELIVRHYFGKQFEKLSMIFNMVPVILYNRFGLEPKNIKGVIMHGAGSLPNLKPWHVDNYFYQEWKESLDRADQIDVTNPLKPVKAWSTFGAWAYVIWVKYFLWLRKVLVKIDKSIGRIGLRVKKHFPQIYKFIKTKRRQQ